MPEKVKSAKDLILEKLSLVIDEPEEKSLQFDFPKYAKQITKFSPVDLGFYQRGIAWIPNQDRGHIKQHIQYRVETRIFCQLSLRPIRSWRR